MGMDLRSDAAHAFQTLSPSYSLHPNEAFHRSRLKIATGPVGDGHYYFQAGNELAPPGPWVIEARVLTLSETVQSRSAFGDPDYLGWGDSTSHASGTSFWESFTQHANARES